MGCEFGIIPLKMIMDRSISHVGIRVYALLCQRIANGDTSIMDLQIAGILQISIAQVARSMRSLRTGGYIFTRRVQNARKIEIQAFSGVSIITDGKCITSIPVALQTFWDQWVKK